MRDTRGLVTRGVVFYIEGKKNPISKSFKVHRLLDELLGEKKGNHHPRGGSRDPPRGETLRVEERTWPRFRPTVRPVLGAASLAIVSVVVLEEVWRVSSRGEGEQVGRRGFVFSRNIGHGGGVGGEISRVCGSRACCTLKNMTKRAGLTVRKLTKTVASTSIFLSWDISHDYVMPAVHQPHIEGF